jgi:ankyrin repeat protein
MQAGGRAGTPAAGALHLAAESGDVVEVRRLAALGVNLEERDADGATALHIASMHGHVEAIKVLVVQLGADKDAKTADGATALHMAAVNGHVEAMKVLLQMGVREQGGEERERSDGAALGGRQGARGGDQGVGGDGRAGRCTEYSWRHSSPSQRPDGSPSGGAGVAGALTHRTNTEGGGDQRACAAGS